MRCSRRRTTCIRNSSVGTSELIGRHQIRCSCARSEPGPRRRHTLVDFHTGRDDLKIFLPPIGGMTAYIWGDASKIRR